MSVFFPWWGQGCWKKCGIWVTKVRKGNLEKERVGVGRPCCYTFQRDFAIKMFLGHSKVRTWEYFEYIGGKAVTEI